MSVAKSVLAGRAVVELGLRDKLTAALKSAKKRLESFGKTLNVLGAGLIGASGAVLGPMSASLLVFASYGDHLAKMATRLGLTTEALSELGHAAGLSGANTESLEKGLRKLHQNLTDAASGSVASAQAFENLGISVAEISNLSTEDALEVIADRISAIQDPAKRTAAAIDLFGRSGAELLPLLLSGSKGIRGMRQEARDLGLSLSSQTAVDAEKLTDALSRVQLTLKALTINVGAALAPLVTELANKFAYATGKVVKFIKENHKLVTAVAFGAVAIGAAGVAFITLGTTFLVAAKGIGLLISTLATIKPMAGLITNLLILPFSVLGSVIMFLPRLLARSVVSMREKLKIMAAESRKVADRLIAIFGTAGRYVTGFFGLIARQASSTAAYLRPLVIGAYRASQAFGAALYSASLSAFAGLQVGARATAQAVQSSWEWLAANAPAAWSRVDAVGRSVFRRLGEYATAASPIIRGATLLAGREVSKIWAGTIETVNAITSPFTTRIAAGWQKMASGISAASRWVKGDAAKTFGGLRAEIVEDFNRLKAGAAATWASVSATTAKHAARVHAVTARAYSAVSGVVNRQLERVSAANQYVVGRLVAHWNSYPRWVREPISKISGMLAADGAKGVAAIRGAFARIPGVASAALRGIKSVGSVAMQQLANTTRAVLSRSFIAVKAAGIGAFRGIRAAGVASMLAVTRATRTAAGKIGGAFSAVGTALSVLLPSGGGALGTLLIVFPLIATAIGSVAGAIGLLFTPLGAGIVLISALVAGFLYFTEEGSQALSVLRVLFRQTFRTFSEMFGGIRDALASGDWKAAANVLFTGLRVVWLEGINYLKSYWPQLAGAAKSAYEKILAFTISVGSDLTGTFAAAGQTIANIWSNVPEWLRLPVEIAWASIVEIFTRGISWARMALTEFSIGIATVFDGVITTLRQSFNSLTMLILDGLAQAVGGFKSLLDMAAKYDPTGLSASMRDALPDAAAFAETARGDMQRQNEQLERDREARDKRRSERLAATRADSDSQIAAAARRRQELLAKYAGLPGADIAKANADFMQALKDARKEEPQKAAAEDAKSAAQAAQQKPKLGNVQGPLERLAEQARSATVSGTFTSGIAAFQQLAAGGVQDVQKRLLERIAKAAEATAENTEEMSGSPGLAFQE